MHRSEGFARMAKTPQLGLDLIASLIPCADGHRWGEPDLEHAAELMQQRLFAQTARFLQLHPHVQHLAVVVVVPQRRLNIGPAQLPGQLQSFLDGVIWLSLEELSQQPDPDLWLTLLTLPVLPQAKLKRSAQQILALRPELLSAVLF